MSFKHIFFLSLFFLSFLSAARAESLTDEAARIYEQSKKSVFQVRVIDLSTDEKAAAGSGFFISDEGYFVTNYHVVSDYVLKPEHYRVEFIDHEAVSNSLELVYFDVVHDLAVMRAAASPESFLKLGGSDMPKGERIFSMGNPHDLGMSIVEGTFNGLMKNALYRKILFSGSLNPGMSGGPALNHTGEVIGINVSTMGNEVSFLVPVEFLKALYEKAIGLERVPEGGWESVIEEQLLAQQDSFIKGLLSHEWQPLTIGGLLVPGEIAPPVRCWGKTTDKETDLMVKVRSSCSCEDYIFISSEMMTAGYSWWFLQHKSKKMNTFRLYNHLQDDFANSFRYRGEEDEMHSDFQCGTGFVDVAGRTWKAAECVRQYKKFRRLYEVVLMFSTVDDFDESIMGELEILGVSRENAEDFIKRFLGEIRWQK